MNVLIADPPRVHVPERFHLAFSGNGRWGACVRALGAGRALESWEFTGDGVPAATVTEIDADRETRALPLDDGRILLLQRDPGGGARYELIVLDVPGAGIARRRIGQLPAELGARLLPGSGAGDLGVVVALDGPDRSTIWRVSESRIDPVTQVPGLVTGGAWLDDHVLACNQVRAGSRSSGIAVDTEDGRWRRIWSMSDTSTDRIVLADPRSGMFVVTTDAGGADRIGWGRAGERAVRFPEVLHRSGLPVTALALDQRGERLLVHEVAGATSRLHAYTPAEDRLEPLRVPAGTVTGPACWTGDAIRFRFSAPDRPPTIATVRSGPPYRWACVDGGPAAGRPARAELVELSGPAGPIEAIVYGGSGWRHCERLVLALHGGPLSAWRYDYDPLFQRLAAAGVAVAAPNYRGSTGYGDAHLRPVIGRWGGPDLEDVCHLGRDLARARRDGSLPAPIVLGASYGAFLALLAAGTEPELWSACVALAPFLSGPGLCGSAGPEVAQRVFRLGGLEPVDADGPRDVLRVSASIAAPLLLVHGTDDHTIPVEQSRTLRRRLLDLGRTEDVDLEYCEVDGDHEGVVLGRDEIVSGRITRFCSLGPPRHPARPQR